MRDQILLICRGFGPLIGALLAGVAFSALPCRADVEDEVVCPKSPPTPPVLTKGDVYRETPFKSGETATYEVTWGGLKAGYGTLEVRGARKHNNFWHRVFHVEASTGDWFNAIFVAKEDMEAISRPWDFGVSKFYMEQNEGKLFSRPFQQKKWLDFDHDHCRVTERIQQPEKAEDIQSHDLAYGASDALGVIYQLRTRNYTLGKKERALVYTSEKNWWLDAEPLAIESVSVPAGTFQAVKLKLQTYIGKDLQQKGDVFAWIATQSPARELVQIQGEIKLGSVWIKLHKFRPGA